jgi:hypothetical protein
METNQSSRSNVLGRLTVALLLTALSGGVLVASEGTSLAACGPRHMTHKSIAKKGGKKRHSHLRKISSEGGKKKRVRHGKGRHKKVKPAIAPHVEPGIGPVIPQA